MDLSSASRIAAAALLISLNIPYSDWDELLTRLNGLEVPKTPEAVAKQVSAVYYQMLDERNKKDDVR